MWCNVGYAEYTYKSYRQNPSEFTEYYNSVKTLYAKIISVDRLLFEGGVLEENPVLNLINKIENNS